MKRMLPMLGLMVFMAACEQQPAGEPVIRTEIGEPGPLPDQELMPEPPVEIAATDSESACSAVSFEDVPLTHCVANPSEHRIRTALGPEGGQPYGSLSALAEDYDSDTVAFAVNAGMYGDDLRPIGYYVENGERLSELNRADGPGNFHLKPNGVFFGTGDSWQVLSTSRFYATILERPEFGTQSGPMLVIDGILHPEIAENGPSRAIRNGVGVDGDGVAHFVRSEAPLSFGQLARFYRDELGVENALFLDGNVSAMWDPASERLDRRGSLGPFLVVEKK